MIGKRIRGRVVLILVLFILTSSIGCATDGTSSNKANILPLGFMDKDSSSDDLSPLEDVTQAAVGFEEKTSTTPSSTTTKSSTTTTNSTTSTIKKKSEPATTTTKATTTTTKTSKSTTTTKKVKTTSKKTTTTTTSQKTTTKNSTSERTQAPLPIEPSKPTTSVAQSSDKETTTTTKTTTSTTSTKDENKSNTIYITRTGKKYHRKNCPTIKNSIGVKEITRAEAAERGLTPCKVCKPDS